MILSEMGTAVGVDWRQNGDESPVDANSWHRRALQRKAAKLVPHENVMSREEIIHRDDECYGHRRHQLLTRGRSSGCRNAPMIFCKRRKTCSPKPHSDSPSSSPRLLAHCRLRRPTTTTRAP